MRILIFVLLSAFPTCHRCDDTRIDLGDLSEEARSTNPYLSGENIIFQHSNGKQINYSVSRDLSEQEDQYCGECCEFVEYEEDFTSLTPDYPVFGIEIRIRNLTDEIYSTEINMTGGISSAFSLSNDPYAHEQFEKIDSLRIDGEWFKDVYRLGNLSSFYSGNPVLTCDSLYYNFEKGIIKITMNNGENYVHSD